MEKPHQALSAAASGLGISSPGASATRLAENGWLISWERYPAMDGLFHGESWDLPVYNGNP